VKNSKKFASLLATALIVGGALSPVGMATAANAVEISPMAETNCSQTITPAIVYYNVNGTEFGKCYNGTTTSFSNSKVVRIKAGAQKVVATFRELGSWTIQANTSQTFGNLTLTKLVVG